MRRKVLVAFHRGNMALPEVFRDNGYEVVESSTLLETLDVLRVPNLIAQMAYLVMDTNLGESNAPTCESSAQVLGLVRRDVEEGNLVFMSFTSNYDACRLAQSQGIPVTDKSDGPAMLAFSSSIVDLSH